MSIQVSCVVPTYDENGASLGGVVIRSWDGVDGANSLGLVTLELGGWGIVRISAPDLISACKAATSGVKEETT